MNTRIKIGTVIEFLTDTTHYKDPVGCFEHRVVEIKPPAKAEIIGYLPSRDEPNSYSFQYKFKLLNTGEIFFENNGYIDSNINRFHRLIKKPEQLELFND